MLYSTVVRHYKVRLKSKILSFNEKMGFNNNWNYPHWNNRN